MNDTDQAQDIRLGWTPATACRMRWPSSRTSHSFQGDAFTHADVRDARAEGW